MPPVAQDLKYGARVLRKQPGFTIIALLALALGMGATCAIFGVVDAVLLRPLPFRDPDRLVVIWEKNAVQHKFKLYAAAGNFREWRQQGRSFEDMAAIIAARVNLTGGPNGHLEPEELRAERVSASLFPLLGVHAAVGRTFTPDEERPGNSRFALLSHRLWERRFGSDRAIVGKTIRLRDWNYTVTGVLPSGFGVLDDAVEVWLPLAIDLADPRVFNDRNLVVIARLKAGVRFEQACNEMETIGDRLEHAYPGTDSGWRPSLFPLREELVGGVRRHLWVLFGAVGLLLLIACVNVANLLLARGAERRREMAIRAALGAGPGRILAQLLSESLLLTLAAGALGLVLARGATAVVARLGPAAIPRLGEVRLDGRLFLFAFGVSVLTGVAFGFVPAAQAFRTNLQDALAERGRGGTLGRTGRMVRSGLVVTEIALAVLVLIGACLLMRSFVALRMAKRGFRTDSILTLRVPLGGARSSTRERRVASFQQIADRLAALPGVTGVGAVSALPLTGLGVGDTFGIVGRPTPPSQGPIGLVRAVSGSYFRVMGIPLKEGREFTEADVPPKPRVVIVNQMLARRYWPDSSAVGGRLRLANLGMAEIVGVVGDVKDDRLESEGWPTIYYPYAQMPYATMTMVLRTSKRPSALTRAAERAVHELAPDQPVADVGTMDALIDHATARPRFNTILLGTFAVIAFALATLGIYGVISYDVSQRTHEIGIRMAMGAETRDVLKLILTQGARLTALGIAAGVAAAFGLTRLMASMLYGVTPTDAYSFVLIPLLLGAVAMFASYLPSRRATALDPVTALRHE
jgi:putative ABC transport system permease protein